MKSLVRRATINYSLKNRRRKAELILKFLDKRGIDSVLMVGVTGAEFDNNPLLPHNGLIEKLIAENHPVKMGINVVPAVTPYPFQIADARDMPFDDDFVDFALANAVIEHVGGLLDQQRMVNEMTRVARSWVITTPNKWFPVESHTHVLFLHWLPAWRRRCNERRAKQGYSRFDLLSYWQFKALLPEDAVVHSRPWSPTFTATYAKG